MSDPFGGMTPPRDAQRIYSEALGEPGERRFRIVAVVDGETWIMWMEKQQVAALSMGIGQILEHVADDSLPYQDIGQVPVDEATHHQFRVGRLELAFDTGDRQIVIAAYDITAEDFDTAATLSVRVDSSMARYLAEQSSDLVARGRPLCPMCGQPIGGDYHVCPEQNGHLPLDIDDELLQL